MAAYRRVYDSHHLQADCKELRATFTFIFFNFVTFLVENRCYVVRNRWATQQGKTIMKEAQKAKQYADGNDIKFTVTE